VHQDYRAGSTTVGSILNSDTAVLQRPTVVIEPGKRPYLDLKSIWEYRELLYFLVWRDLKVRYKQTAIGVSWTVLQPLIGMVIFTVIFGYLARIPSDGIPYPIFAFCGLLPWTYFATSLNRCMVSVVADAQLVSKVFFPRLILPLSGTMSGLVDFLISLCLFFGLMNWYGFAVTWRVVVLPGFLLLALLTALGIGLWFAALNVRYRDIGYVVPFLTQIWMFASPIIYPASMIPEKYRWLYSLNPMTGVIEAFRWTLLGKAHPDFLMIAVSAIVVLGVFAGGLVFFRRMERTFADVI
jgi:lipopolysaccharide transport system permease protein